MQIVRAVVCALCVALLACESSASQSAVRSGRAPSQPWSDSAFLPGSATWLDSSVVELPHLRLHPAAVPGSGKVVSVPQGADLQRAIDRAHGGDILELAAGATFRGPFYLKRTLGDTGWITVRTQGADDLVPRGIRATPMAAAKFAKITSPSIRSPAIVFAPASYGFRLTGLEIVAAADAGEGGALIEIGSGTDRQDSIAEPHLLLLDRLWIHGVDSSNFRRCIALNSASTAIVDSWLSDCHGKGFDSQAIAGWNGSGPYLIANNFLEGAGENVMFGGADPRRSGVVPSDIEIVRNHFYKPPAWRGQWSIKNSFELKIGRRVLVEGNVFENNWTDGQDGFAIVLKSVNQENSAPWSQTTDVTFRSNIIRNVAHGLNAAGKPEGSPVIPMSRLYVVNNLFQRVGSGDNPGGRLIQVAEVDDCTIVRNTGLGVTHGVVLYGGQMRRFKLDSNVIGTSQRNYDVWNFALSSADGAGFGIDALKRHTAEWSMHDNLMPGVSPALFPGNWIATDLADMNFKNFPDDLHIDSTNRFLRGNTAKAIGVDFVKLDSATRGAVIQSPQSN